MTMVFIFDKGYGCHSDANFERKLLTDFPCQT